MTRASHKFQAPKGTRDFYPAEMAVRRYIESVWRSVSINHGFEEIEGPMFEHLDLYTVKSGEGIVSELFSFRRAGGDTDYALRPEFTPTLARMVASRANTLAFPVKWFCIPNHFRAERPQRGRLREFVQWNVDMVGDASVRADAEVLAVAINVMRKLGLRSRDITIHLSHRALISEALGEAGVSTDRIEEAMGLLDRREKLDPEVFADQCAAIKLDHEAYFERIGEVERRVNDAIAAAEHGQSPSPSDEASEAEREMFALIERLDRLGLARWCAFSAGIVRGLAYYTGIVFEVHESGGKERAIAGGGRYDRLVELFGGPATPAVGFAMGDVVIRLVLEEKGLLKEGERYLPRPDVFVIAGGVDRAVDVLPGLVSQLRAEDLHVRHSYRSTRNIGKLLGEANRQRARCAIILGEELEENKVTVKDLVSGEQRTVSMIDCDEAVLHVIDQQKEACE